MIYDKAKYHFEGDFPPELPKEQAYVHGGMFLGWLSENALLSNEFCEDFKDERERFRQGELRCGSFFHLIGGVLADDMLAPDVIPFVKFYYGEKKRYYADYCSLFHEYPTIYHVDDNPQNFRRLSDRLNERFEGWKAVH